MTFWNFWFVCMSNCESISMLIIHRFKTYFCMTFSIWRRVTWSLWIFEKMTFWNFWFVLNCASISMFNIWVLTYFGQWKKGYTMYASKLSEIIAFWNYHLEANSEFGDSDLVLLMKVGVSNLVIVNVKIQRQVLVWVLV